MAPSPTVDSGGTPEPNLPARSAAHEGYHLHAGVGLAAAGREALERLRQYLLRPPLRRERLSRLEDGTVEIRPGRWTSRLPPLTPETRAAPRRHRAPAAREPDG
ncbi:MAG: transposase [Deltaproteobacteria bacterium]|nr:transposase [Deltaproteobacteria bacterium]